MNPPQSARRPNPGRVLRGALVAASCLGLSGCVFAEDLSGAQMYITNRTDETLRIGVGDDVHYEEKPGETLTFSLNGDAGDCTDVEVRARTADEVEAAHTGPPVCDQDHWTIAQVELDRARQLAGRPAPSEETTTSPAPEGGP